MNDPKYGIRDNKLWHKAGEYFVPEDEPTMLFRGKDPGLPVVIRAYMAHLMSLEPTPEILAHIKTAAERLEAVTVFQLQNPQRVTHGCHRC